MNQVEDSGPDGLSSVINSQSKNERHDSDGAMNVPRMQTAGRNQRWDGSSSFGTFLLMAFMLFCTTCQADSNQCIHKKSEPLHNCPFTYDEVVEHGTSTLMCCSLSWSSANPQLRSKRVSDLEILVDDKLVDPDQRGTCSNDSTALDLTKLPPSKFKFTCRRKLSDSVSWNYEVLLQIKVIIGLKPIEPRNVKCVSFNWEKLFCTWEPVHNYVSTQFSPRFEPPGLVTGDSSFNCSAPQEEPQQPPSSCSWEAFMDPSYRMTGKNYNLILDAENAFGNHSFTYSFHSWAQVIPSNPVNLSVFNETSSSALLRWSVPSPMQNFSPGLHYRVSYRTESDHQENWRKIDITNETDATEIYFNLPNLESNTAYNVRVLIKSSLAVDEEMWGPFSEMSFKTPAMLPCLPPAVDLGSFEIVGNNGNRDVHIYWQSISRRLKEVHNFTYQVVSIEENGRKLDLQPHEITKTYAIFKGMSFNELEFEIMAANCEGENDHKATVHVPSQLEMPRKPVVFTKIAFDGGIYELSWNPPRNSNITNYTIFWCEHDRDGPYKCYGYLDWIHIPGNLNVYNVTVPNPKKVYQFAIAANTAQASSGMVWFSGSTASSRVSRKIRSVWTNRINSDSIEVEWELECSDLNDIADGVNIHYCPILSPYNLTCAEPRISTTISGNPIPTHSVVGGLKPYTTYMLTITISSEKDTEGLHGDPLYFTTLQAPPSPPQNVVVTNVTNTTMSIEWQPPSAMNGVLRYYVIFYNRRPLMKVEKATKVEIHVVDTYNGFCVSVAACTMRCVQSSAVCADPGTDTLALPFDR